LSFRIFNISFSVACTSDHNEAVTDEHKKAEVRDNKGWEQSSLFESASYSMIGKEGHIGFIYDEKKVTRFYPGKVQKYMWHFWGDIPEGDFKVVATREKSGKKEKALVAGKRKVWSIGEPSKGKHNGADASLPSHMSLPAPGLWKLDAYIGEELFGSIFVKVHKK
jgi:hypothetical protein